MNKSKRPGNNEVYIPAEETVCNFMYLSEIVNDKTHLIIRIMDAFLRQVPGELRLLNEALKLPDYPAIRRNAHTMMSSVSIMGITSLNNVLKEIEKLAKSETEIEKIKMQAKTLDIICKQAIKEIEKEKINYMSM